MNWTEKEWLVNDGRFEHACGLCKKSCCKGKGYQLRWTSMKSGTRSLGTYGGPTELGYALRCQMCGKEAPQEVLDVVSLG